MTPTTYEQLKLSALAGTLSDAEARRLDAYHAEHPHLAAAFAEEQAAWQHAIAAPRPEKPDAYWDSLTDRIMADVQAETIAQKPATPPGIDLWLTVRNLFALPLPRLALQTAFAVLLVAFGVLLGRSVFDDDAPQVAEVPTHSMPPETGVFQPVAAEEAAWRYIDRSKVLLLGIVNAETPEGVNLVHKQTVANELVASAPELRKALGAADQQRLADLVADLEVLLMQIANLEAQADVPGLELVQHGVERESIFLKISLEEIRRLEPVPNSTPPADAQEAI